MLYYFRPLTLLLILLFLFAPNLSTANTTRPLIKVGIFPLEPLNFVGDTGKAQGLYPALIKEIAKEENWQIQFVPGSWAEGLTRLQSGEIDLVTTIANTPERAKRMDFSHESVVDIWGQIYTLPKGNLDTILDLQGARVGVMRQDINGQNFITLTKQLGVHCQIIEFSTHTEIFQSIQDKDIVAGVAPQHYGLGHTKEFNLVASSIRFSPFPIYFATKKGKNGAILQQIDLHLTHWKRDQNSFYHDQLAYWMGGKEREIETLPDWLLISTGIGGIIVAFLLFLNRALNIRVKKRTLELSLREKQYRDLVENANSIILRWDKEGKIIFLNEYGLDIFAFTREEVVGQHVLGTIMPSEDSQGKDMKLMLDEILRTPEKYKLHEHENISKNGKRLFIQWSNKAILDNNGTFIEMLSVGTNTTKRKDLETNLFQAQKMEAIGTLAGGIAHDFNNILSVVFGYTELAKLEKDDPESLIKNLEQVLNAAQRAKQLVQQILTFSRKTGAERHPLQLSLLVKETIKMLRATIPTTISIKQNIVSNQMIIADPTQIHQLLMNLATNAFHAMEENGGTLGISLKDIHVDTDKVYSAELDLVTGDYIQIEISDTGSGIPAKALPNIFEPYFTTKPQGKGTGLGLAVVHGVVREHHGHIKVYSVLGEGSTFHVYFPVAKNLESHIANQAKEQEKIKGGNERILIVDDELQITKTISKVLDKFGYKTESYTDPKLAMEAFENDPDNFDIVITDMTMPGLTGFKLAEKILSQRPTIPIILCTGYSELINKEKAIRLGITAYLQKPVELRSILETVRETLDSRANQS